MEAVKMEDYLEGARNCYQFLGITPGQQVLLLPTLELLNSDPMTLEALTQVGKQIGAQVSTAIIEKLGTRGNPPRQIARAIEDSDVFIGMGDKTPNPITGHCLTALRARWDYGAKQVDLRGGKGILATECSRFPVEILLAIVRKLRAKLKKGHILEISDDKGTQLSFPYKFSSVYYGGTFDIDHLEPGQRSTWPLGYMMIHPEDSFSGNAMVDCVRGVATILGKPVRYVIDNCRVDIEDREETKSIKTELAKPENTNFVSTLFLGINPKGSISNGVHRSDFGELAQAAGVVDIGIGDRAGYVSSNFYTEGFLLNPTITLGKEMLSDHGRLSVLDEPEVRELASKYGHPKQLLAAIP